MVMTDVMLRTVSQEAHRPLRKGVRVMEITCDSKEKLGGRNGICLNPFISSDELKSEALWPLDTKLANRLAHYSFALSLAEAIKRKQKPDDKRAILIYLLALVRLSAVARDELNLGELPLLIRHRQHRQLANSIEKLCKDRLQVTGYAESSDNWSGWASTYRLWLRSASNDVRQFSIQGADKRLATYDFNGKNLTGGRLWAGSALLLQW